MSKYLPFINSRFVQEREWPTPAVGPNYTRAVFAENGPGGNMVRSPILVAGGRSFAGLGGNEAGIFSSKNVLGSLGASSSEGGVTDFNFGKILSDAIQGEGGGSGQACNSDEVIKAVQSMIGTTPDGKWGPASQAKLVEAGTTFKGVAPGCTGNPPGVATTGGGGTAPVKTGGFSFGGGGASAGSAFDNPMTWIVLAAVAAGGIILFGKKKKAV